MDSSSDKVRHMHDFKDTEAGGARVPSRPASSASRDMSIAALVISILGVVLLVIFFFGLNSNVKGLSKEVMSLKKLEGTVSDMGATVAHVQGRVADLEQLPIKTRNMVVGHMLSEVAQSTEYLSGQVENKEQSEKLAQALKMIRDVGSQLREE